MVANNGDGAANNVVLDDDLSSRLIFISATGGGVESGGIVSWNFGTVEPGAAGSVSFSAQVVEGPVDYSINNSATLSSDETGSIISNDTSLLVTSSAELTLSKSVSATTAGPGETLVYSFDLSNLGGSDATDVLMTDTLPADASFVSADNGGTEAGGVVTWNLGTVFANQSTTVSMTVRISDTALDGTELDNSATITSNETFPVSSNTVTTTVDSNAELRIDVSTNPDPVSAGDELEYTITVENVSTDPAENVVLTTSVPSDTTYITHTGGGDYDAGAGLITWNVGIVPAGESGTVALLVLVDSPLPNGTNLSNSTNVSADNAPSAGIIELVKVSSLPLLSIQKSASTRTAQPGEDVTYTLTYTNSGTDVAENVVVEDQLPTDVTFVSASDGGIHSNGLVSWNVGLVGVGQTSFVTVTATVNDGLLTGTVLPNVGSIFGLFGLPVSSPVVNVTVNALPDLRLEKTAPDSVEAGAQLVYTLNYENVGNSVATGVVIADMIPANTMFVSASDGGAPSGSDVTWNIGDVPIGGSGSVTLTVEVDSPLPNGTLLQNASIIKSDQTIPAAASLVETLVSSSPILQFDKTVDLTEVIPGDQLTYTFSYENTGNDAASGVTIIDRLPPDTAYVSSTPEGTVNAGIVTWNLGTVEAGASGQVTLVVDVNSPLDDGTRIFNLATMESAELPPKYGQATTNVIAPVLELQKTVDKAMVEPGQSLVYTLSYSNTGSAAANGVQIVDTIPEFTTVESSDPAGTVDEIAGTVTWDIGTVDALSGGEISLVLTVDDPLDDGTILTNSAELTSEDTEAVTAEVSTEVNSEPILELLKTSIQNLVRPGNTVTYVIAYRNIGGGPANGVQIVDTIPEFTTVLSTAPAGTVDEGAGTVTWDIGTVAGGEAGIVTMVVTVDNPLDNGTVIFNTASMTSDELPELNDDDSVTVIAPVMVMSKSAEPAVAGQGDEVRYTISLQNTGSAEATNVILHDVLAEGLQYVSSEPLGTYDAGTREITWDIGILPPSASPSLYEIVAVVEPTARGMLLNTAIVDFQETLSAEASAEIELTNPPTTFKVTKFFSDDNPALVDVYITCNGGNDLEQSYSLPDSGVVTFSASGFSAGELNCDVYENPVPDGYMPSYAAGSSTGLGGVSDDENGCHFTNVVDGGFSCEITNAAMPGAFTVNKVWVLEEDQKEPVDLLVDVTILCDREILTSGAEFDAQSGFWTLSDTIGDGGSLTASVDTSGGAARCMAEENFVASYIESDDDCGWRAVKAASDEQCTFTNTVFFGGIPTLNRYGLGLAILLMLGVGFVAVSRFNAA